MLGFRVAAGLVCFLRQSGASQDCARHSDARPKRQIKGPMAAGVAGRIYRKLNDVNYFAERNDVAPTSAVLSGSRQ